MPEHEQLDVFHVQAAPATDECAQHGPDGEVEEGERHATDPPNPLATTAATSILAPFTSKRKVLPPLGRDR